MGNTALITGASSGIGAELARLHAARGGDLVLVARREEALNALKQELVAEYGVSVSIIVADLSEAEAAEKVFAATEEAGSQVDILINNAGIGGHGKFHERDLAKEQAMMQLNMISLVNLTHLYMRPMVSRKQRENPADCINRWHDARAVAGHLLCHESLRDFVFPGHRGGAFRHPGYVDRALSWPGRHRLCSSRRARGRRAFRQTRRFGCLRGKLRL